MTAPRQILFDEDAFGEDQQVSTALLKDLSEQVAWCGNERRQVAVLAFSQMSTQQVAASKLPRLYAAQWACYGPLQVYLTAGTKYARLNLRFTVEENAVEVVAFSGAVPLSSSELDAATSAGNPRGDQYAVLTTSDTDVTLELGPVRTGWNSVWLAIRSAKSATTATSTANITSPGVFVDGRLRVVPDIASSPGFGVVPEAWFQIAEDGSFDGVPYYTAAWCNTSDDDVAIAEDPYEGVLLDIETGGGGGSTQVRWGNLGVLQLESVALDTTQTRTVEQESWWASLRWYGLPSAVQLRSLADRITRTARQRMPMICMGLDQVHNVLTSSGDIGGLWRVYKGGFGASTKSDPGYIAAVAWYSGQASTTYSGQMVQVSVPICAVNGSTSGGAPSQDGDVEVTLTAEVFAVTDTTFSTPLAESETTIGLAVQRYGDNITRSWIVQTAQARDASDGSTWGMDGLTRPEDVPGLWAVVTLDIDVSGMTADTPYYIAVKGESVAISSHTVYAVGPVGMVVLNG